MNFNIIENYENPLMEYDKFKKDFLDPSINVKALQKKYNISRRQYCQLRDKVLNETGLSIKPSASIKNHPIQFITDYTYIRTYKDGNYFIQKLINGKRKSFGVYPTLETTRKVRDKLIESDWNEEVAEKLKQKYAVKNRNKLYNDAMQKYDEFEKRYNNGNTARTIKKNLNLTDYQYNLLSKKVRTEKTNLKQGGK